MGGASDVHYMNQSSGMVGEIASWSRSCCIGSSRTRVLDLYCVVPEVRIALWCVGGLGMAVDTYPDDIIVEMPAGCERHAALQPRNDNMRIRLITTSRVQLAIHAPNSNSSACVCMWLLIRSWTMRSADR